MKATTVVIELAASRLAESDLSLLDPVRAKCLHSRFNGATLTDDPREGIMRKATPVFFVLASLVVGSVLPGCGRGNVEPASAPNMVSNDRQTEGAA